jgi:hypothetical protein
VRRGGIGYAGSLIKRAATSKRSLGDVRAAV